MVFEFQYRKRYGCVATWLVKANGKVVFRFNTASGMDALQHSRGVAPSGFRPVSIPQAVWMRCNIIGDDAEMKAVTFQYRKRYGCVATACLETRPQTRMK